MQQKQFSLGILLGILSCIFFISLGLLVLLNYNGLYYYDIKALKLSESTGMSESMIRENYDALMQYCTPWFRGELQFPSLPSSAQGLYHFVEVKRIFTIFYFLFFVTLMIVPLLFVSVIKKGWYHLFRISAITSWVVPVLVGITCTLNFDKVFHLFHTFVFQNDYWIFDPNTDPIILLLPSNFFFHCAIAIALFVLLGSIAQFFLSFYFKKKAMVPTKHHWIRTSVTPPATTVDAPNRIKLKP